MQKAGVAADGSQALWRRIYEFPLVAMILAIALFMAASALGVVLIKALPPLAPPWNLLLQAAIEIALVLAVYKLAIVRLGERPRDDLPRRGVLKHLSVGLLAGFLLFSLIVGIAAALGVYRITGWGDASQLVPALVSTAILPGLMEELLFRGILFRWIEEFAGTWAGLALSSLAFGFAHYFNPNANVIACLWIAIEAGILLGGAYMLTRNLWMPICLHAAWNFTQGEIFSVPVSGLDSHGLVKAQLRGPELLSGGQFGLEASVIALVVATAAGIWLVALAVRRGHLVAPSWVRGRKPLAPVVA